jgi:hypothetical protein
MAQLRKRFAPDPARLPDVVVRLGSLDAYEALIGSSPPEDNLTGDVA